MSFWPVLTLPSRIRATYSRVKRECLATALGPCLLPDRPGSREQLLAGGFVGGGRLVVGLAGTFDPAAEILGCALVEAITGETIERSVA